jgi:hypothetical protein
VENPGDELIAFAIVPNYCVVLLRQPLEHATLLPVPGPGGIQVDPPIAVFQIHHADPDVVLGRGGSSLELDFVAQYEPVVGRKLQFVVIAKPMKTALSGYRSDAGRFGPGSCFGGARPFRPKGAQRGSLNCQGPEERATVHCYISPAIG